MSEQQSKPLTAALSFIPVLLLCLLDIFALYLQAQSKALAHLSFAVLTAQLLCILVFAKGEICNGQRARLVRVNLYFLMYWTLWLVLSLFSNYHYVLTDIVSLCGIAVTLAIWLQPQEAQMRKSLLMLGALLAGLGMLTYALMFIELPLLDTMQYNLTAQLLTGVILTNIALVTAKNRLRALIALFPFAMLILLLINALIVLALLAYAFTSAVVFANELALGLYFVLHLLIAGIIGLHIFLKRSLDYNALLILLFISASLPLWIGFSYMK
ncbi:hypothetical protein [Necropsobacter massiliensis]|uniref:hypothetical protein n=1 Tax=Necropsobacter massiliensis TaxID=1400001 RepID=UPI000595B0D5|nr:hypothetical protein [Necropsobacter massiliensis]